MCFLKVTLIHTELGVKPIEQVQAGDKVAARNQYNLKTQWRQVLQTFSRAEKEIVHVAISHPDGRTETISSTTEHPFYVVGKGWTGANALQPDDALERLSGGQSRIVAVTAGEGRHTVYNFEVADDHTYFVGAYGIWVHNASTISGIPPQDPSVASDTEGVNQLTATQLRNSPGTVTASGALQPASGAWLDAATPTPIPGQVADALVGKTFNSFDDLRGAIWQEIGNNPGLSSNFSAVNQGLMSDGYAPFAPQAYQIGDYTSGQVFNLHHIDLNP